MRLGMLVVLLSGVRMAYIVADSSRNAVRHVLHPRRSPLTDHPGNWGLHYEDVAFPSVDGTTLRGWFIPGASKAAVILAHGLWVDRQSLLSIGRTLNARGDLSVLLFDFRGVGESDGDTVILGFKEQEDILGALAYLQTRPDVDEGRIGVMGTSLGAGVALLAAAENTGFGAVVADSPFESVDAMIGSSFQSLTGLPAMPFGPLVVRISEWETGLRTSDVMPARRVAGISPTPLFITHDLQDKLVPYVPTRTPFEAALEPKELWLVDGADHVGARSVERDEYDRRLVDFLRKHLAGRPAG